MRDIWTQRHSEGGHVKMEAETGMMQPQAKEGRGLPASTKVAEVRKDSSWTLQRGQGPAHALISNF
jgi:hypothetical protein